jgi:transposase
MARSPQQAQCNEGEPALYVAVELSATRWHLASGVGVATPVRRKTIEAGDRGALQRELAQARARFGVAADAPVRSCYEAGRDGFWVHRWLAASGVTNVVVDSSSIEVSRRARRAKTDRLDAEKLFRLLCRYWGGERGVWHVVHVPDPAVEDARHHERMIATLVEDRTRWRNRIHGLLATCGVHVRLDAQFLTRLAAVRDGVQAPLPPGLIARVQTCWTQLTGVQEALRTARHAQRVRLRAARTAPGPAAGEARAPEALAAQVQQLKGIGVGSALLLAKEVFSRDLHNRREVGALSGLVPVPYQSGAAAHDQGISRAGLRPVRAVLVEVAWQWLKWQPDSALTQWYHARFGDAGRRPRKVGIVALARRLLIALWRYTRTGEIPPGAVLRRVA